MKFKYIVGSLLLINGLLNTQPAQAQKKGMDTTIKIKPTPIGKFYLGNSLDAAIFSIAPMTSPYSNNTVSTLRFSYAFNIGANVNYDFHKSFGLFTGLSIKNVGFIEKIGDSTVKRRTYNLCLPLGIKVGDLKKHNYFFAGVDLEVPFNYKEKGFVKRGHKEKFNEWFGNRTPSFMPAVFGGMSLKPGVTVKLEYYLNNFLNTGYTENGYQPYAGYKANLILLSFGVDIHYTKPKEHKKGMQMKFS